MSNFRRMFRWWLVVAVPVGGGCGGANDSALFRGGAGTPRSDAGTGAMSSTMGAGGSFTAAGGSGGAGEPSAGGLGGESNAGAGGLPTEDSGVTSVDAGVGGLGGGGGSGGMESSGGAAGVPGGAWARCNADTDCVGGRVCTKNAQAILVSGRPGGCVRHCGLTTAQCDAPPDVGTVTCTQLLVASFCTITCSIAGQCPTGMDCVGGVCYHSK